MKLEIPSSDGSKTYSIDTVSATCTCPDFKFRGSRHSIMDERRLCKHLTEVYDKHPELKPIELVNLGNLKDAQLTQADGKIRYLRNTFDPYVDVIQTSLSQFPEVDRYEICGSYRRRAQLVSDLDVLIVLKDGTNAESIFNYFENFLGYVQEWRGPIKAAYKADGFIHIDFKIVPLESWAFALLHFTGSKYENIAMRRRATSMKLKLNEYGLFDESDNRIEGNFDTEESIYNYLSIPYKEPWNR